MPSSILETFQHWRSNFLYQLSLQRKATTLKNPNDAKDIHPNSLTCHCQKIYVTNITMFLICASVAQSMRIQAPCNCIICIGDASRPPLSPANGTWNWDIRSFVPTSGLQMFFFVFVRYLKCWVQFFTGGQYILKRCW